MKINSLNRIINNEKFQVMPSLTMDEQSQLVESIKTNGILVPIIIDNDGAIIDGHNRYEIAVKLTEMGIDVGDIPVQVSDLTDDTTKRKLAYELNLQRRHLSVRDKKKAAEKMWQEFPEMSTAQMVKTTGLSRGSAVNLRKELEEDGKIETTDIRKGADGKTYSTGCQNDSVQEPEPEPEVSTGFQQFCEEVEAEQQEEDTTEYLKVGIMQGNVIRTTKTLEGFKARSKKACPIDMIEAIVEVVNASKLPPNEEGWEAVKQIVAEHTQVANDIKQAETTEPEPVVEELPFVPEPEPIEEVVEEPVKTSRKDAVKAKLEEINKREVEEIGNIIQEEINKVAGALKSPVFSKWLSKAVKGKLKEIHPDISNQSDEAVEFVNAWNVIKKFIERGN